MCMKITEVDCTRCGLCAVHCPLEAIRIKGDGQYEIDIVLCNGCDGLSGICCVKACNPGCIADALTGEPLIADTTDIPRVRPDTLLQLVAIMGSGNSGHYTRREELKTERSIIAKAFMNPSMEIQIVSKDPETARLLGLEFGQTIVFWDAVSIARQKVTSEYLKTLGKTDGYIKDFLNSLSPYKIIEKGRPT